MKRISLYGLLIALCVWTLSAAEIEGFVGQSSMQVAPGVSVKLKDGETGKVLDIDETNFFGKYSFEDVVPGYYHIQAEHITREVMVKKASDEKRLDIDLSAKGGVMDYSKAGQTGSAQKKSGNPTASQTQNRSNNETLANQIAGVWWGYAGSTERQIGLCPGGAYKDYTESGYSGQSYNSLGDQTMAWGAASQGGGQGRWTIQGDTQSGTIYVQYNNGQSRALHYNQIGDPGCLNIDGSRLCRKSATCQ